MTGAVETQRENEFEGSSRVIKESGGQGTNMFHNEYVLYLWISSSPNPDFIDLMEPSKSWSESPANYGLPDLDLEFRE